MNNIVYLFTMAPVSGWKEHTRHQVNFYIELDVLDLSDFDRFHIVLAGLIFSWYPPKEVTGRTGGKLVGGLWVV